MLTEETGNEPLVGDSQTGPRLRVVTSSLWHGNVQAAGG